MQAWVGLADNEGADSTLSIMFRISPIDAAQLYAARHGFFDLDVDTDERGVKIVASAHKRTLTARGRSLTEACKKLVEAINGNG